MSKSYATCGRYRNVKADKEKSENVTNFYVGHARLGRSDETMYRNRMNDYGYKAHGPVGQLPLPMTGMIRF
jgi:hypothetical protein